jgi:hypothetical protein
MQKPPEVVNDHRSASPPLECRRANPFCHLTVAAPVSPHRVCPTESPHHADALDAGSPAPHRPSRRRWERHRAGYMTKYVKLWNTSNYAHLLSFKLSTKRVY